ncbi:MAG: aldehyde ferredoxin oxidoreductase [Eggerthellaceae bacterium]|nr:aldehyde ferredoxin oxidoreductase [Eggerthellaceae bacterium]MCH4220967.1 aldehyde ferredoxin oxidoreductase [Eggerthellaceae bacterium]
MADAKSYGWAGKILRVNLTTGEITTEPTEPYKTYIGGMGLANKIMYDEVPAGTDPLSPDNKVVFAVGPLTATGVPLAGRTTICSLSTFTQDHLVVDAHCGGMIGAKLKLSGHDALIVEGASDHPVYINIVDDKVEIKDASDVWGLGTRATTEALCRRESTSACVACIGPASENLLPYGCIINARNHSAGAGTGTVLGSKKVKAIVVEGNSSINVKDPQSVADLSDYMLREIVGSNNNHVVPSTQQEWAEYYDKGSRWTARKGLTWALAEGGPIDTGEPKPGELNTVGYRCMKSTKDLGAGAEKYTIKMNGCHSCPIHCYSDLRNEESKAHGGYETVGNTCAANFPFLYLEGILKTGMSTDEQILWNNVITSRMDDLGLWCNYAQLWRDMAHCIKDGIFKANLPEAEYNAYDWSQFRVGGDPQVMVGIMDALAKNNSELAYLAHGPLVWTKRWHDEGWFDKQPSQLINYRGWPVHHAIECFSQVGGVYNMMFNRDDMIHSAVNFQGCGLPIDLKKQIGAEVWGGEDAVDPDKDYTPMNEHKANFCWWSIVTDVLHDSLTLCNWVWPMTMSPTKARDYRGDLDLEAKFFKAVTGEDVTTDQLYQAGAKIMTLQRCNTMRGMGTNDFRNVHDKMTEWPFTIDPDKQAFTKGTIKQDHDDFQTALTMVYKKFEWDEEKGCPTEALLDKYDMGDVKADLKSHGLM